DSPAFRRAARSVGAAPARGPVLGVDAVGESRGVGGRCVSRRAPAQHPARSIARSQGEEQLAAREPRGDGGDREEVLMLGSGPGSPLSRRGRRSSRPVGRRDEIESGSRVAEEQRSGASRSAVRITANFRRGRSAALVVALAVMAAGESRACGRIEAQGTRAKPASAWAPAAESGAAEEAGARREELEPEPIPGAAVQLETGGASLGIIRLEARDKGRAPAGGAAPMIGLSPERARLLLRSLTVPGWAQATGGRRTAAAAFGLAELSIWTSF